MAPETLVSVVIPTYNERQNVAPLLARLRDALAGIESEIIFVDDSDDGTPAEILRHKMPGVSVVHRERGERAGGLSTAVLRGIAAATGRYVCIMDGDLQHPPETIPALLDRAQTTDADIVIASRNVAGGSSQGLDGPWRRFVSWAFGLISRAAFYEKLRKVKDPLSGFLLVRRASLDGIVMRPVGYKISLEILIRAAGSHVEEVPYTFMERTAEETKARLGTGLAFVRHVLLLLLEVPEVGRFWKFGAIGGTGLVLYISMLWLLTTQAGLHYGVAWAMAAESAVLSNFTLNRNFTWFERRAVGMKALVSESAKYHVASSISVAANGIAFFALTAAGVSTLVAGAISVWIGVATSFLGAERFVFTTRRAVAMRRTIVPIATPGTEPPDEPETRAALANPTIAASEDR
jgi:glycosyltransferase involved in cell wall biosynthesis